MNWLIVDNIIKDALKEDCSFNDITTSCIIKSGTKYQIQLIAKEDGIIAGVKVFKRD